MTCVTMHTCTLTEQLEDRQAKIQREVVDARHGVSFVMVTAHHVCVVNH